MNISGLIVINLGYNASKQQHKGYKMKKLNLAAMLLGAALFTGLGAVSLSASDMKCGAGKCGSSMKAPAKKCGSSMKKCGASMKKDAAKCGAGKCGDAKKEKKKAMKCGAGKCGAK